MNSSTLTILRREAVVRDWVRRRLGSVAHELRVARTAKMLFDLTRRWHDLGSADCRTLVLGALVHDVGRSLQARKHARNGASMVLEDRWLPLSATERRRVAYLARHHKGKVPAEGTDDILDAADDARAMTLLLGLLRVADALDSRMAGGPRLIMTVRGRSQGSRVLSIYGYVESDTWQARELYGKPKKLRLLEESLSCEIRIEWFGTAEVGMVG